MSLPGHFHQCLDYFRQDLMSTRNYIHLIINFLHQEKKTLSTKDVSDINKPGTKRFGKITELLNKVAERDEQFFYDFLEALEKCKCLKLAKKMKDHLEKGQQGEKLKVALMDSGCPSKMTSSIDPTEIAELVKKVVKEELKEYRGLSEETVRDIVAKELKMIAEKLKEHPMLNEESVWMLVAKDLKDSFSEEEAKTREQLREQLQEQTEELKKITHMIAQHWMKPASQ